MKFAFIIISMISFTQIVSCNGTVVYESVKKQMLFHTSGKLSVLLAYDGMMMLKLDSFEYGINPKDQIMVDINDPQFALILYLRRYPEGTWIIKINQNYDSVYSCLNQKCYLKDRKINQNYESKKEKKNQNVQNEQKQTKFQDKNQRDQNLSIESHEKKQGITAGSMLIGASKGIGTGLKYTGKLLSWGFQSLGGAISKKVQKQKDVQISQSTKQNLALATKTSKNVLQFTAAQVSNLFKFGKQVGSNAVERFQHSQKGQQYQSSKYYDYIKSGGKTGVKVIANLYDGVVNAVYEVGSGLSNGATKIIGAKYGKDAEEVADEVLEGTGNVAKIVRTPYDEGAKAFKQ